MRKLTAIILGFALSLGQLLAQTKTITGKVMNEKGEPLAGASIGIKGAKGIGTTVDNGGNFTLVLPPNSKYLVISSIGYLEQEVAIGGQDNYAITLKPKQNVQSDVVIVAYGTAKKNTFTGSASTIKSEDIQKLQVSDVTRTIGSLVPGVQVSSNSGQPGSGVNLRIRGVGSINASANPLIIVDGVPYGGDFNAINPTDVESISVLKDAASTSLYGSRAANGLVIITTKKGKGKPKFEIQARFGINSRGVPEYDIIRDPGQFLEVYWQSVKHGAMFRAAAPLSEADASLYASQNLFSPDRLDAYNPYRVPAGQYVIDPTTGKLNSNARLLYHDDWENELFANRSRQEYVASMSGGSDKTQYFMSLGYLDDQGIAIKTGFNRLTTRLRLDQTINTWAKAGINFSYAKTKQDRTLDATSSSALANMFSFTRGVAPVFPIWTRNASGNFVLDRHGKRIYDFGNKLVNPLAQGTRRFASNQNPRATFDLDTRNRAANNVIGRAYMEIKPVKEVTATVNYGVDYNTGRTISFQNALLGNAANTNGRGILTTFITQVENINQLVEYKKDIQKHSINVLVGHESYKNTIQSDQGYKEQFMLPLSPELGGAAVVKDAQSSTDFETLESFFSRVQYEYNGRYLFSASFRRDGSSRFAPQNRWGNFWSLGAGYVISEEDFMKKVSFVNQLKLKLSYGTNGNNDLLYPAGSSNVGLSNYYPYTNQYIVKTTGTPNIFLDYVGNANITWERLGTFNTGIEFSMFNNRLNGSIDYYVRKNHDLLFQRPRALSTGVQSVPDNIGDMVNKGIDLDLNYQVIKKTDFVWSVGVNFNHNKNKITRLPDESSEKGIVTALFKYLPGRSIYDYFIAKYAGVDYNTGLALYYKDEVGVDGQPTGKQVLTSNSSDATRYYLDKSALPNLTGGINTQVTFKNFDLSILTGFGIGGWVYDDTYSDMMHGASTSIQNWHKDILNSWTPSNRNTNIPRLQENYQTDAVSDRMLIRSDYFDIRNITLGYSVPVKELEKFGLSSFRFYAVADNIYLLTRRKGLDPRQSFSGAVYNGYSPIRTFSVGFNVGF